MIKDTNLVTSVALSFSSVGAGGWEEIGKKRDLGYEADITRSKQATRLFFPLTIMLSQENNRGGTKNDLLFASSLRLLLTRVFNDNYFWTTSEKETSIAVFLVSLEARRFSCWYKEIILAAIQIKPWVRIWDITCPWQLSIFISIW